MPFNRLFRISLALCCAALCCPLTAQTTYYVSPNGDNAAAGTSLTTAWQTIRHGLATIAPGDTLLVDDGLYVETGLELTQVSTADKPTVLKSINQWGAKIEGTTQYSTILQTVGARHAVIEGFEIFNNEDRPFEDWNTGLQIFKSNYVTLLNNYVHDCGCGGISGRESDYMFIRRNVTRDNAKTNPYNCSGISIYQPIQLDDEPGTHILIAENVTFENECRLPFVPGGFDIPTDGNGIILDDFNWTQGFGGGPTQPPFVAETIIENNLSFNNGGAGMKAFEVANAIFRNNTSVHNNYVLEEYGSNIAEIAGQAVGGDVVFHNNLAVQGFGQEGWGMYWEPNSGEATLDVRNNVVVGDVFWRRAPTTEENNTVVNYDNQSLPRFARILPDDFTFTSVDDFRQYFAVRSDSPAIGYGDAELAPDNDLNGNPRPADGSVDAGAFEGPEPGVGPVAADRVLETVITSTSFPVEVDGLKDPVYRTFGNELKRVYNGNVSSPSDLSAEWTATWDDQALYIIVDVRDGQLRNDSPDAAEDDGIEIFIDADNSRGDAYDGVNDFRYLLGWNDNVVLERAQNATAGVVQAQRSGFNDYTKEVSIPWATLGVSPEDGLQIGIDVRVNDDDNGSAVDARLSWQDRVGDATSSPAVFGTATLQAVAPPPPVEALGANVSTINVDGNREAAWDAVPRNTVGNLLVGELDGETDLAATWSARWNPVFLYLLVEVTDDVVQGGSSDAFNDDALEIYLDMGLERSGDYDGNDFYLSVRANGNSVIAEEGSLGQGTLARTVTTDGGYNVEMRIPWASLGFTAEEGKFFGFDLQITDDDTGGFRDSKISWFATTDESDENPARFGYVYLTPADPNATFDQRVARPLGAYPNPTVGPLTLDLPARPERISVTDLSGRTVRSFGATVRPDLTGLPAGSYVITARANGQTYRTMVVVE